MKSLMYSIVRKRRQLFAITRRVGGIGVIGVSMLALLHSSAIAQSKPKREHAQTPSLKEMIAQKFIIDLRHYCEPAASHYCQQPVTTLHPTLRKLVQDTKVGGVILFGDNLVSAQQILKLNHDLQGAALSTQDEPLYIAIDQEGGRVARLPNYVLFPFAGNMALGASYANHGVAYASAVANKKAEALKALGFNLNFAPSLDVNSNPNNPIINVRSFSQDPQLVADLGVATIRAYQSHDIATAAKHFPGHGDTFVDSHVGLPRVEHDLQQISKIDIYPFKRAIDDAQVDMIMTAHIQYPALDNTTFIAKNGTRSELPATLSANILQGLLREKLNYQGIIVSDALDMAAINAFLSPEDAVIKAFSAGVDIALMPFRISSKQEVEAFEAFLTRLSQSIAKDPSLIEHIRQSYQRILAHKRHRKLSAYAKLSLEKKQLAWQTYQKSSSTEALATELSGASFTVVKGFKPKQALSFNSQIYAVMPDKRRCQALLHYLQQANFTRSACSSMLSQTLKLPKNVDLFIVGNISPYMSFYESRYYEGIEASQRLDQVQQALQVRKMLQKAEAQGASKVLFLMRSPYIKPEDMQQYDGIYASYDYQVRGENAQIFAPSFASFTQALKSDPTFNAVAPVELLLRSP